MKNVQPVYATQFGVKDVSLNAISERVESWIGDKYRYVWGENVDFPSGEDIKIEPLEGHRISYRQRALSEGELFDIRWDHPDQQERPLNWSTRIAAAKDNSGALEVNVQVGISSSAFSIRPFEKMRVGTPSAVQGVLEDHNCVDGNIPITTSPHHVRENDVSFFVEKILESKKRRFPVVLLSKISPQGDTIRDVGGVQRRLKGLAHVYDISFAAGFELTDLVGVKGSCYHGAVRVYWPEYERSGDFKQNTMFFQAEDIGSAFEHDLFDEISSLAALRYQDGPLFSGLNRAADFEGQREARERRRKRQEEIEELRRQVERGESSKEELLAKVETLERENEGIESEKEKYLELYVERDDTAKELDSQVRSLSSRVETQADNIETLRKALERQRKDEILRETGLPVVHEEAKPDSVEEALLIAEEKYEDQLEIWETAHDSASKSASNRASQVLEAFGVLAEVAEEYFDNEGELGDSITRVIQSKGPKCSGESGPTMQKYGDRREFRNGGNVREMQKHITIKSGTKHGVQIYFCVGEADGKFIVGYCGEHLPYASENT